jgi:hypothetical protein
MTPAKFAGWARMEGNVADASNAKKANTGQRQRCGNDPSKGVILAEWASSRRRQRPRDGSARRRRNLGGGVNPDALGFPLERLSGTAIRPARADRMNSIE